MFFNPIVELALVVALGFVTALLVPKLLGLALVASCAAWLVLVGTRTLGKNSVPDGGRGGYIMLGQILYIASWCLATILG